MITRNDYWQVMSLTALTLLVGEQKGHLVCENLRPDFQNLLR